MRLRLLQRRASADKVLEQLSKSLDGWQTEPVNRLARNEMLIHDTPTKNYTFNKQTKVILVIDKKQNTMFPVSRESDLKKWKSIVNRFFHKAL